MSILCWLSTRSPLLHINKTAGISKRQDSSSRVAQWEVGVMVTHQAKHQARQDWSSKNLMDEKRKRAVPFHFMAGFIDPPYLLSHPTPRPSLTHDFWRDHMWLMNTRSFTVPIIIRNFGNSCVIYYESITRYSLFFLLALNRWRLRLQRRV